MNLYQQSARWFHAPTGRSNSKPQLARKGRSAAALLAGAVVAGLVGTTGQAHAAAQPANLFIIGAFLQPTYDMAAWAARGVNTMVDFNPGANSQQLWESTATALGMYVIRAPSANPKDDIKDPWLLAWAQPDEPDVNDISAATLQATYNSLKAVNPQMPVYLNVSGFDVLYPSTTFTESYYQTLFKAGDWISGDIYPVTGFGRPDWIDLAETGPWNPGPVKWNAGVLEDTLRSYSNGKPQYTYIETSYQGLYGVPNERGPTADEVRGETWDAIIHGARGIVYFPFAFSPWSQDATPPSVAAGITTTDAIINSLGAVINSGSTSNPQLLTLTSPTLEGTWRKYDGIDYFFVLNFSHTAVSDVTVNLPGINGTTTLGVYDQDRNVDVSDGLLTDSFGAYQMNIYTTDPVLTPDAPGAPAPVPEPGMGCLLVLGGALLARRPRRRARTADATD